MDNLAPEKSFVLTFEKMERRIHEFSGRSGKGPQGDWADLFRRQDQAVHHQGLHKGFIRFEGIKEHLFSIGKGGAVKVSDQSFTGAAVKREPSAPTVVRMMLEEILPER